MFKLMILCFVFYVLFLMEVFLALLDILIQRRIPKLCGSSDGSQSFSVRTLIGGNLGWG